MNLSAHPLTMTVLVTQDMANFAANVHGGYLPKFLARRLAQAPGLAARPAARSA